MSELLCIYWLISEKAGQDRFDQHVYYEKINRLIYLASTEDTIVTQLFRFYIKGI